MHRSANVLDKLPKRLHARAKRALHEIMRAETRKAAQRAIKRFARDYEAEYPKPVASRRRDEGFLAERVAVEKDAAGGLPRISTPSREPPW